MHPQPTTAVAVYARVSTEDQAERQTVQAQLDFLRKFCDLHQLPIADEYVDDGISGTVPLDERPEGRRMLDDAEGKRFAVVLVYRLDRLGRSLKALLGAHDRLDSLNVAIRSATEPFDTTSPIGRFVFQLLGSIAELERETISERMSMGRNRVAAAGRYTGGVLPFGYDVDEEGRMVPSSRMVVGMDITEAELVRRIFSNIAGGSTLNTECAQLTSMGVPTGRRYANGKKVQEGDGKKAHEADIWTSGRLWYLMHNPVYKGAAVFKSRRGEVNRPAPAIVEPAIWDAAQTVLSRNRRLSTKNAKTVYLLRGLITCELCGRGFVGTTSWTRTSRTKGKEYKRYVCASANGTNRPNLATRCRARHLDADAIEATIWADCREFIFNPGDALADAQRQLRARLEQVAGLDDRRRQVLTQITQKDAERERVLTVYRRGRITTEEAESQLDEVARETATLREMLESLRAQEALAHAQEAHLSDVAAMLTRLRGEVEEIERTNDLTRKKEIIGLLVSRLRVQTDATVRPKRATVSVTYSFRPASVVQVDSYTSRRPS